MGDITDKILSFRRRDIEVVVAAPRMIKLTKIARYMPCRVKLILFIMTCIYIIWRWHTNIHFLEAVCL